MHADITVYRLGVTLRLHVNETKVMSLDETKIMLMHQQNETNKRGRYFMTEFML